MDAYVQASFEFVADSDIANELGALFTDAFDRLEASAFALGTGGGQPWGAITRVSAAANAVVAGTSGSVNAADFVLADVYAVDNALPSRYRANASWVANIAVLNRIRRFGEGSTGNSGFWTDLGPSFPSQLPSHGVYECSEMDSTIVSGSTDYVLALADWRQGYVIVDRLGTTLLHQPMVVGSNRRPTGEVGWAVFKRVGADVLDSTNSDFARILKL
jgi:HK97 family phage major capsid protein